MAIKIMTNAKQMITTNVFRRPPKRTSFEIMAKTPTMINKMIARTKATKGAILGKQ
jgi:hypothetical protein